MARSNSTCNGLLLSYTDTNSRAEYLKGLHWYVNNALTLSLMCILMSKLRVRISEFFNEDILAQAHVNHPAHATTNGSQLP